MPTQDLQRELKAIQAALEDLQREHDRLKERPVDVSERHRHAKRLAEITERIRRFREVLQPALDSLRERLH